MIAALAAAFFNALAKYLQQGAAKRLDGDEQLRMSQLWALVRQPRWLAGEGSDVMAFLVQAVALGFGGLILVMPLLVMALPFAVALRAVFGHQPPGMRGVLGSVLCLGGISLFLVMGRPTAGGGPVTWAEIWPSALGLGAAVAVSLAAASRIRGNRRAVAFAFPAAVFYAVTAAAVRVLITQLSHGVLAVLAHWSLYVVIGSAIAGVILVQQALKAGDLPAPVAVITVGNPLLSIGLGILWLGESLRTTPLAIAAQAVGIAAVVAGVVVLAGESSGTSAGTRSGGSVERGGLAASGGRPGTAAR